MNSFFEARGLALFLILPLLHPSAAGPLRESIKGIGETIDPKGDCRFALEKGDLTIRVPGTLHDLSVEVENLDAPRVLQEIRGDWLARVEIDGKISHEGKTLSPRYLPFHGAGLLVWKDEKTYVRLERAFIVDPEGKSLHYVNFELRRDGRHAGGVGVIVPDKKTFLRISRRGNKLIAAYGSDGRQWTDLTPLDLELPPTLKVGVDAVNTSNEPLEARFHKYAVVRVRTRGPNGR